MPSDTPAPELSQEEIEDLRAVRSDIADLRQAMIVEAAKRDLVTWAKRWSVIVLVAAFVGGAGLIFSAINAAVKPQVTKSIEATTRATDAAKHAQTSADKADEIIAKLGDMEARADEIGQTLTRLRGEISAETGNVRARVEKESDRLQEEVDKLTALVATLAKKTADGRSALNAFTNELKDIQDKAEASKAKFDDFSKFTVYIHSPISRKADGDRFATALLKLGFKASNHSHGDSVFDAKFVQGNNLLLDSSATEAKAAIVKLFANEFPGAKMEILEDIGSLKLSETATIVPGLDKNNPIVIILAPLPKSGPS